MIKTVKQYANFFETEYLLVPAFHFVIYFNILFSLRDLLQDLKTSKNSFAYYLG